MTKLEAMLEQRGIVSPREMSEAVARCQLHGGDLTTSLLQFVSADEAQLSAALSECYALPAASVGLLPGPDDAALRSLPREIAERYCCFPLEAGPGRLVLAVAHPLDPVLKDELAFTLGVSIEERVALEVRIRQALARFYGLPMSARNQRGIARLEGDLDGAGQETPLGMWPEAQLTSLPRPPSDQPPGVRDSQRPPSARPRQPHETPRSGVIIGAPLAAGGAVAASARPKRRDPLTLAQAREELSRAPTRNDILDIFFGFAAQFFEYSALFAVHNALAEGLDASGNGADREALLGIGVPLDLPSSLSEAAESCKVRLTRLGKEGLDRTLMTDLERQFNGKVLILPVSLRGRCALLLYADNGEADVVEREIADVVAIAPDVANALGRIILQRKKDAARSKGDGGEATSPEPRPSQPAAAEALAGAARASRPAGVDAPNGLPTPAAIVAAASPRSPSVRPAEERADSMGAASAEGASGGAPARSGRELGASVLAQPVVAIGPNTTHVTRGRPSAPPPSTESSAATVSAAATPSPPAADASATPAPGSVAEDPVFLLARPQVKRLSSAPPRDPGARAQRSERRRPLAPMPEIQKPQVEITRPAPLAASRPRLPSVIVDPEFTDPEAAERATRAAAITRAPAQARSMSSGRRPMVPPPADAPRSTDADSRRTAVTSPPAPLAQRAAARRDPARPAAEGAAPLITHAAAHPSTERDTIPAQATPQRAAASQQGAERQAVPPPPDNGSVWPRSERESAPEPRSREVLARGAEGQALHTAGDAEPADDTELDEALEAAGNAGWPPPIMDNSPPPRQAPLTALVPIIIADSPKSKRGHVLSRGTGRRGTLDSGSARSVTSRPPSPHGPTSPTVPAAPAKRDGMAARGGATSADGERGPDAGGSASQARRATADANAAGRESAADDAGRRAAAGGIAAADADRGAAADANASHGAGTSAGGSAAAARGGAAPEVNVARAGEDLGARGASAGTRQAASISTGHSQLSADAAKRVEERPSAAGTAAGTARGARIDEGVAASAATSDPATAHAAASAGTAPMGSSWPPGAEAEEEDDAAWQASARDARGAGAAGAPDGGAERSARADTIGSANGPLPAGRGVAAGAAPGAGGAASRALDAARSSAAAQNPPPSAQDLAASADALATAANAPAAPANAPATVANAPAAPANASRISGSVAASPADASASSANASGASASARAAVANAFPTSGNVAANPGSARATSANGLAPPGHVGAASGDARATSAKGPAASANASRASRNVDVSSANGPATANASPTSGNVDVASAGASAGSGHASATSADASAAAAGARTLPAKAPAWSGTSASAPAASADARAIPASTSGAAPGASFTRDIAASGAPGSRDLRGAAGAPSTGVQENPAGNTLPSREIQASARSASVRYIPASDAPVPRDLGASPAAARPSTPAGSAPLREGAASDATRRAAASTDDMRAPHASSAVTFSNGVHSSATNAARSGVSASRSDAPTLQPGSTGSTGPGSGVVPGAAPGVRPAIFPPPPAGSEIDDLVEQVCQGNLKAVQDLARIGAPSVPQVMARFPGPVISERAGPSSRASECGPLLQALAAIGEPAMPSITRRSEDDDARVRRWATLLLGEMPGPEACRAVVQRLADDEPRVHQAALDAARLLLASEAADLFRKTLFEVAEADEAPLTLRLRTLEHVAKLKDSASVPRLIAFLAADVEPIVHKALWALTVVTRHDFGRDARAWSEFWQSNQHLHRVEWLIAALDQQDARLRRAASEELREEAGELFGYAEESPRPERLEAQRRFLDWWRSSGAQRRRRPAPSGAR